ncbi:hypothetical protein ZIOFF_062503 [Zingiber officinale]|uniref:GDSL esterase/lipase n=1 Tax=Zingiber officinale TaxID=94328 RepID=A0A8J5F5K8_ZINOF|nr:hypothetical protein ZIOFF_062503 [Zingiber officinale]
MIFFHCYYLPPSFSWHFKTMWIIATILVLSKINSNEGAQFPAMFVFGDSLLDPGNNNNLLTLAKANYFPNGIDFSIGTTGRYCNGGTLVDHLGKLLGLPFVPTFKNPSTNGSNILKGVNYASAGAGILWDTGLIFGDVFTMDEQIQNFKKTIEDLSLMLGNKTTDFLGRSLFFISMGANDYINNYLHPLAWRYKKYPIVAYEQLLIQEYSRQIKDIYDLGARKIFVSGVPPLGCIPNQIGGNNDSSGECIRSSNRMAVSYNNQVSMLAGELNATLAGASFLFWNNYKPVYDIIHNYSLYEVHNKCPSSCVGGCAIFLLKLMLNDLLSLILPEKSNVSGKTSTATLSRPSTFDLYVDFSLQTFFTVRITVILSKSDDDARIIAG